MKKNSQYLRMTWLIAALSFFTLTTMAVNLSEMKFRRIDTRNGLSNSQANCVLKDSRGYVWIGTQYGLNRFDGFRVRSFYSKTSANKSLKFDFYDALYEASDGMIWIRQGVNYCIFNPDTEMFDYDLPGWMQKHNIPGNPEYIHLDSRKNIWVKPYGNNFFCYNPRTGKVKQYPIDFGRLGIKEGAFVSSMADLGKSCAVIFNSGDIICMNSETGKIDWGTHYVRRQNPQEKVNYKIWFSPKGDYWVVCPDGKWIYRQDRKKWYNSLDAMLKADGFSDFPENMAVWDVHFEGNQELWLATDHNGLVILDYKNKTVSQFLNDRDDRTTVPNNNLISLYAANDGSVWICGMQGGVSQCTRTPSIFNNYPFGVVNCITQDQQGNYWLGTNDKGIICYNPKTRHQTVYNTNNSKLESDIMVCLLNTADGSVWAGTYGGGLSHIVDGKVNTYMPTAGGLAIKNIWGLAEDGDGKLWIGTLGSGVQSLDPKTGKFVTYNSQNKNVSSDYVSSMQMADNGWIVVGTSDFYSVIDPKISKVVNMSIPSDSLRGFVPSASSTQVVMDSRGLVWYASPSGLSIYDTESGNVSQLDEKNGLESSSICGVIEDRRNNMWVATEFGLAHIVVNKKDGEWAFDVVNYSQQDGLLPGPHNKRSMCLSHDGTILLGGVSGVDIISPQMLRSDVKRGRPVFAGLMLFDKEIGIGTEYDGRIVLKESLEKSRRLVLKSGESQFTIQMGTNQGLADTNVQFTYRLEGLSNNWITTEPNNPNISFTGLPSGTYTLVVKISGDEDGKAKESRLQIVVEPPFYATWWAYVLYVLIALLVLRLWMRHEQKKLTFERMKMQKEAERQQSNIKYEVYSGVNEELRQPFEKAFVYLEDMMKNEDDEQRYQQMNSLRETLDGVFIKMTEHMEQKEKKELIVPKITETEITSVDQQLVDKATAYVETNISNGDITVETMSEALNMSRVHLYKRLTAITGQTPSEFIRDIRLRHAERLLRLSQLTVSEISYKVGINNPRYFSKYFKDKYGMLPSQYKSHESDEK
ncbi:MAG: two-component regulator propeller domain-containing protein [Prevotella sp.]